MGTLREFVFVIAVNKGDGFLHSLSDVVDDKFYYSREEAEKSNRYLELCEKYPGNFEIYPLTCQYRVS